MPGRRRETRFLMSPPVAGALHTLEDVVVQQMAKTHVWILSSSPASRVGGMTLEVPGVGGTARVRVQVAESNPVVVDDRVQHRVRLQVLDDPADEGGNVVAGEL